MSAARITNRTDYAVRAILYLSLQQPGLIVPIPEIAEETGLSVKFLEEILLLLRTSGIVQSRRGKQGGYSLLRSPQELKVVEVVQALEGETSTSRHDGEEEKRPFQEVVRTVFDEAAAAWWDHLTHISIQDLVDKMQSLERERLDVDMFHI